MYHLKRFFGETAALAAKLDIRRIEEMCEALQDLRKMGGRLFIAGLGGSAANASHAANDFRKLCEIESYALHDNAAEFTAHANDDGWAGAYVGMLESSNFRAQDALLVLSVGGGSEAVSVPLVRATAYAKKKKAWIMAIVGRDGGYCKIHADFMVLIPTINEARVTPHVESFQSVILHALVSHPSMQIRKTKW